MRSLDSSDLLAAALLAAALAVAVLAGGGFDDLSRAIFVLLAASALLTAIGSAPEQAAAPFRSAAVAGLLALAALGALSSLWTVGSATEALRWAPVVAAYAAVAVTAGVLVARAGEMTVIAPLVAIALVAGSLGLYGAAAGAEPLGLRIGGEWRPAGTFEYPPALALLQLSALPALIELAGRRSRPLALLGALGLAVAGATLALSQSRVPVVLALATLAAILLLPAAARLAPAPLRAGAISLTAAAAAGAYLVAGGLASGDEHGLPELAGVLAIVGGLALAWLPVRERIERAGLGEGGGSRFSPRRPALAGGALLAALALAAALTVFVTREGGGIERAGGALHGREAQWEAAIEVASDHPLLGAGSEAYYEASFEEQGRFPVLYAHSLPLETAAELGAAGLLALLAIYAGVGTLLFQTSPRAALIVGPGAAALLLAGLVDWSWHLAGSGAIWAACVGGLLAGRARASRPGTG